MNENTIKDRTLYWEYNQFMKKFYLNQSLILGIMNHIIVPIYDINIDAWLLSCFIFLLFEWFEANITGWVERHELWLNEMVMAIDMIYWYITYNNG